MVNAGDRATAPAPVSVAAGPAPTAAPGGPAGPQADAAGGAFAPVLRQALQEASAQARGITEEAPVANAPGEQAERPDPAGAYGDAARRLPAEHPAADGSWMAQLAFAGAWPWIPLPANGMAAPVLASGRGEKPGGGVAVAGCSASVPGNTCSAPPANAPLGPGVPAEPDGVGFPHPDVVVLPHQDAIPFVASPRQDTIPFGPQAISTLPEPDPAFMLRPDAAPFLQSGGASFRYTHTGLLRRTDTGSSGVAREAAKGSVLAVDGLGALLRGSGGAPAWDGSPLTSGPGAGETPERAWASRAGQAPPGLVQPAGGAAAGDASAVKPGEGPSSSVPRLPLKAGLPGSPDGGWASPFAGAPAGTPGQVSEPASLYVLRPAVGSEPGRAQPSQGPHPVSAATEAAREADHHRDGELGTDGGLELPTGLRAEAADPPGASRDAGGVSGPGDPAAPSSGTGGRGAPTAASTPDRDPPLRPTGPGSPSREQGPARGEPQGSPGRGRGSLSDGGRQAVEPPRGGLSAPAPRGSSEGARPEEPVTEHSPVRSGHLGEVPRETGAGLGTASANQASALHAQDRPQGLPTPAPFPQAVARQVAEAARRWLEQAASAQPGVEVVEARLAEGGRELRLRLHPPELGELRFYLTSRAGQLSVSVGAERPETGLLLERHLGVLQQALEQAGLRMGDVSVQVGVGLFGRGRQDGEAPGSRRTVPVRPLQAVEADERASAPVAVGPVWVGLGRVDVRV